MAGLGEATMVAWKTSGSKLSGRGVRAGAAALSLVALLLLAVTAIALAATGALTQLPSKAGCVSENGTNGQ